MNAEEFEQLLAKHANPIRRFGGWLKVMMLLVIFEIRRFLKISASEG
jgi:hypothetical protein